MTFHEPIGQQTKERVCFFERVAKRLEDEAHKDRYATEHLKRYALLATALNYRLMALKMRQIKPEQLRKMLAQALHVAHLYEQADTRTTTPETPSS